MVIMVSTVPERCTIVSMLDEPTAPIRLIWAGVNFGKLRSTQDWYWKSSECINHKGRSNGDCCLQIIALIF